MNVRSSLLVAVTAFLVTGCCSKDCERSRSFHTSLPVSAASFVPSRHPGTPVNCPGVGNPNECVVPIAVRDLRCYADDIVLDDFVNLAANQKIVWQLPAGFVFCPRAGDGVFLKDPNVPDGLFDPKPSSRCSDTFEWKRLRPDGNDYAYQLRFRTADRICGVKDPWMRN